MRELLIFNTIIHLLNLLLLANCFQTKYEGIVMGNATVPVVFLVIALLLFVILPLTTA